MFADIIRNHAERYPKMQIQDIYKLAHQAAKGSDHAVVDLDQAKMGLAKEMQEIGNTHFMEPLVDPISADGEIVRIHLRPFSQIKEEITTLAEAFHQTALFFQGRNDILISHWEDAVRTRLFSKYLMKEFFKKMEEMNFPAVHHSEPYRLAYQPAYRVIWKKFLPTNLQGGK